MSEKTFDIEATGEAEPSGHKDHFSVLVCIDGSDESYRALRYAVRIGSGTDANLTLLYVRPVDQGMRTGGLDLSVARANLLDWGLELPGMKALKKGRDMLIELGWLGADWQEEFRHADVTGDPLGDNMIVYTSEQGRSITLKLMVSPSIAHGILDEGDMGDYDLVILPMPERVTDAGPDFIEPGVAEIVAMEYTGTVLVARALEESHGHLLCVSDNEESIRAARKDAQIASRCACPVYLFSVARNEDEVPKAEAALAKARKAIEEEGIGISGEKVALGDAVEAIIEEGRSYSVIVVSAPTRKKGWRRFFTSSVAFNVLERAYNSVMIAR